MSIVCRQNIKSTAYEREFCRAFLNNENPIWNDDNDVGKICKRGFRLPPDDFVYGLKHPKQNGITALQYYDTPIDISKSTTTIPNFIAINKAAVRLGLTKVQDIHQYRRTMNNHQRKKKPCCNLRTEKNAIPDIIHGRVTGERPSIRDLIENKYLHEWLYKTTMDRCKKILNMNTFVGRKK